MTAEIITTVLVFGNALFAYWAVKNQDRRGVQAHLVAAVGLAVAYGCYKLASA